MLSKALHHYPQYVFRDGEKLLWNPVLKKAFVNRPEERVRLQIIEYFLEEAGYSSGRISFELPVRLPGDKSASRSDIIFYDKDFAPFLLVECKAPSVALNDKAAVQAARYNREIRAPYMLITNGLHDFWFGIDGGSVLPLPEIPPSFGSRFKQERDFAYWEKRGFAGAKSHPDTRRWIVESCNYLYGSRLPLYAKYLNFDDSDPDLALSNYYYLYRHDDRRKLAAAMCGTPYRSTRLSVVFNVNGQNEGMLSCSLDLLAKKEPENSIFINREGTFYPDLAKETSFDFDMPISDLLPKLIPAFLG